MTITFSYNFQPTSLTSLDVRISQEDLKEALDPFYQFTQCFPLQVNFTHATIHVSVSLPEPSPQVETFKKKDVVEILSHKKAYNACE